MNIAEPKTEAQVKLPAKSELEPPCLFTLHLAISLFPFPPALHFVEHSAASDCHQS